MIHLNIGSNLNSKFGNRFKNISIAINLLINSKLKIIKFQIFMKHHHTQIKITSFLKCWCLANYNMMKQH